MSKVAEKNAYFSEEKILRSEPQFIDIYKDAKLQTHPLKMLLHFFKGHYLELIISAVFNIIKASPVWILPLFPLMLSIQLSGVLRIWVSTSLLMQ